MQLVRFDEGKVLHRSDSPWLGTHVLIFRLNAIEALRSLIERDGELLPIECEGVSLEIFNSTRLVDVLDEEASSVSRFSDGRIMMIDKYVFRPEAARYDAFKIANLRVSPTFLSHRFVERWIDNALVGLDFHRVWPPEREKANFWNGRQTGPL